MNSTSVDFLKNRFNALNLIYSPEKDMNFESQDDFLVMWREVGQISEKRADLIN